MDVSNFQIPKHWPADAQAFARESIAEIQGLKDKMKPMILDLAALHGTLEKALEEIRELKAKLGTNSSNSHKPPRLDPPGPTPNGENTGTSKKQGAQKGHKGAGRTLFPPERVDVTRDIFPEKCPISGMTLRPEELVSLSWKRFHQVDLPEQIRPLVTEFRLHICRCPCGCGKKVFATMPADAGNTVVGPRFKALMALLATRYHLSKALIREVLIDICGPDATFSKGCISEAEAEIAQALEAPYEEAKLAVQKEPALHVDETSWFLKHKIHWLWIAVARSLTVFRIDSRRSRAAFERFLGDFEGFIISDRFSAYAHLSPEERQLCWAHLTRDFRKLVDRQCGGEAIGSKALEEIDVMFGLWRMYLDGLIDQPELKLEFVTLRARFGKLLKKGKASPDGKAAHLCKNLLKVWPSLWNFLQRPDILQPTNNRAEQGIRPPVMARMLSLGSQSERGLRFVERMWTMVATLRCQGRKILEFINQALLAFRGVGKMPTLVFQPSG